MSKTQKHTPLPWKANQSELDARSCRVEIRGPGDAYIICTDTGWANADFIVRACNSYYELTDQRDSLIKALEFLLSQCTCEEASCSVCVFITSAIAGAAG